MERGLVLDLVEINGYCVVGSTALTSTNINHGQAMVDLTMADADT